MNGQNTTFMNNVPNYLNANYILVPEINPVGGAWANGSLQDFDLQVLPNGWNNLHLPNGNNAPNANVMLLSDMAHRGQAATVLTHRIRGYWLQWNGNHDASSHIQVNAANGRYVFTNRLGGCAVGVTATAGGVATVYHDGSGGAGLNNVGGINLRVQPGGVGGYDPNAAGDNTTAVFYYANNTWQVAHCLIYDAGIHQTPLNGLNYQY
jgi:hypothetical protein